MNRAVETQGAAHSIPLVVCDGPLLVFGGPYSNLEATRAVLEAAADLAIPRERMICTGDVAAYGADAAETVELVHNAVAHVVMGNCEDSLGAGSDDCGCGFPAGSTCERLSSAWFAHASRQLRADQRAWMAGLPRRIDISIGGARLTAVHAGVESLNRFIFASTAAKTKVADIAKAGTDGIIGGHCGLPFTQTILGRLWHNAGAIGMPANDGTPRAWFSLLTPDENGLLIEHKAIAYDHAAAAAKMRRAGLPEGYSAALETGLWPSCDVLPLREIREQGAALSAGTVHWRRSRGTENARRRTPIACEQLWPVENSTNVKPLAPLKFKHQRLTAGGEPRASVPLRRLETLWFNTGTLCNIACRNCYIESSPRNDRLVYLTRGEVAAYLDEIERDGWGTEEIGFTGGEPFMNPDFLGMMDDCLARGFRVLVLTNAMRPMQRLKTKLLDIKRDHGRKLTIRVSLDHFNADRHEDERGPGTFKPTLDGLIWLARNDFRIAIAGRTMWSEDGATERAGYARLFAEHGIRVDADDPAQLVLFPEMNASADVPEITTACWGILGKSPTDVMCSSSRMVIKRKGSARPAVIACTLLPYEAGFELGSTLKEAAGEVWLNHPHCAAFCVLGGGSCSRAASGGTS